MCPPVINFAKWNCWFRRQVARDAHRKLATFEGAWRVIAKADRPKPIVALKNFSVLRRAAHPTSCDDAMRAELLPADGMGGSFIGSTRRACTAVRTFSQLITDGLVSVFFHRAQFDGATPAARQILRMETPRLAAKPSMREISDGILSMMRIFTLIRRSAQALICAFPLFQIGGIRKLTPI